MNAGGKGICWDRGGPIYTVSAAKDVVAGGFELAVWSTRRVGFVMEAAVGEWTAEALVEEQEQECNVDAFCGQAVGVMAATAL
jgi:hypothetical protein